MNSIRNKFSVLLLGWLIPSFLLSQDVIEIGGPQWTWEYCYTAPISIDGLNDNDHSQYVAIFDQEELGSTAYIASLSWYKRGNTPAYLGGDASLKIYLKHTTLDIVSDSVGTYEFQMTDATLVYDSFNESIPAEEDWINYPLDAAFLFNGTDNLMMLVEWYQPGESSSLGIGNFWGTYTDGKGAMWRGNSFDNLAYFTSASSADRPVMQFETAVAYDVGIIEHELPNAWTGTEPIVLTIENFGADTLTSFDINWSINDVDQSSFTWNGILPFGQITTIELIPVSVVDGLLSIVFTSSDPNGNEDQNAENDEYEFEAYACGGPLSGIFSVGESGDFHSLTEISVALNSCGVSGHCTFSFDPGIYEGQLTLNNIEGLSENASITFLALDLNSSSVILKYAANDENDNWIVKLDGSPFVRFEHLTFHASGGFDYSRLVWITDGSSNSSFDACQFIGYNHNSFCGGDCGDGDAIHISYEGGDEISGIEISNNFFKFNSSAVYANGGTDYMIKDLVVSDNILRDQHRRGFFLTYCDNPILEKNHIRTKYSFSYAIDGIDLRYCIGPLKILSNNAVVSRTGMIVIACISTDDDPALIANNFIYLVDNTCAESGMLISENDHIDILHNTVSTYDECDSDNNAPLFLRGNNYRILNNIFENRSLDPAVSMGDPYFGDPIEFLEADHNLYNGSPMARVDNDDFSLAEWSTYSGADENSSMGNPSYIFDGDPHLSSAPAVSPNALIEVAEDIDGEPRDQLIPTVGADELPTCSGPLSGTYYIGSGQDYSSIREASFALMSCGISNHVVMRILSGAYEEQIDLFTIPGSSESSTVTFISDTEDANDVTIRHAEPQDHILSFTEVEYVRLEHIMFSGKGIGLQFNHGAANNEVKWCDIHVDSVYMDATVNNALGNACVSMTGLGCDNNRIEGCKLTYGLYGVRMQGEFSFRGYGNAFINNVITAQEYYGIYGEYFNESLISGNRISNHSDNEFTGIHLDNANDNSPIALNQILISGSSDKKGMRLYYSTQDTIVNNFIHLESSMGSEYVGVYLHNSSPKVLFNTVNIEGELNIDTRCTQSWIGSLSEYKGNLFVNLCEGYTRYEWGTPTGTHNQFGATRTNHIRFNNVNMVQERDLFVYNLITGQEDGSIEETPSFVGGGDLHLLSSSASGNAAPIAGVNTDIDGDLRSETTPDFGADEFGFSVQLQYEICIGDSILIGIGEVADAYNWSTGETSNTIEVSPVETTEYELWISSDGDSTQYWIEVSVVELELPELADSLSFCNGDFLVIDYPGIFDAWNWSNGSESDSTIISSEGMIYIEVIQQGCSAMDSVFVHQMETPVIDLGENIELCNNDSLMINVPDGLDSWSWSDGSSDSSIIVIGTQMISLQGFVGECASSDTISITNTIIPELIEIEEESICEDSGIFLIVPDGLDSWEWSNTSGADSIWVNEPGEYWIQGTIGSCVSSDTLVLFVEAIPTSNLPNELFSCGVTSITPEIDAMSFSWWNGSSELTVEFEESGAYWLELSGVLCHVVDSIDVTIADIPSPDLGDDLALIIGDSTLLEMDSNYEEYLWSDESSEENLWFVSTDYGNGNFDVWVEVTNEEGCSATDSITIEVFLPSSLNENSLNDIKLYPNPTSYQFIIEASGWEAVAIRNLNGQLIWKKDRYEQKQIIDCSQWATGIYFVQIYDEEEVRIEKLHLMR